jgi:hypothetical protein
MVKVCGVPAQPANTGVTVTVEVTATLPVFTPANTPMLPLPEAASPIEVLSFVQL